MKILVKLFSLYVKHFVNKPYCIDCKEQMEYEGYMVAIASVIPTTKRRILVFRCDEDDVETHISPDGTYRVWRDGTLL